VRDQQDYRYRPLITVVTLSLLRATSSRPNQLGIVGERRERVRLTLEGLGQRLDQIPSCGEASAGSRLSEE
jgi:hypothetical protein